MQALKDTPRLTAVWAGLSVLTAAMTATAGCHLSTLIPKGNPAEASTPVLMPHTNAKAVSHGASANAGVPTLPTNPPASAISDADLKRLMQERVDLPSAESAAKAGDAIKTASAAGLKPGVIVYYPTGAADLADFGAGCGFGLEVLLGGQPQFAQSPLIDSAYRAVIERKHTDPRLSRDEALQAASVTGATHIAVGTIAAKGTDGVTLSYQVYTRDGKAVGDPVVAEGTRNAVAAAMPGLALKLAQRIGGTTAPVSALTFTGFPTDPALLAQSGSCSLATLYTPEQTAFLRDHAATDPLAAFLYITASDSAGSNQKLAQAVANLLGHSGDNTMAFARIARQRPALLAPYATRLKALAARYPDNYLLARSQGHLAVYQHDFATERAMGIAAIHNAPNNPDAYTAMGVTISRDCETVRRGKPTATMTVAEQEFLSEGYPALYDAYSTAVRLDPLYASAWARLIEAAAVNGNHAEARDAYEQAVKLGSDLFDTYGTALNLFAPKWGGAPGEQKAVADAAAGATYRNAYEVRTMVESLKEFGFPVESQSLADRFLTQARAAVARDPKDPQAHYDLAIALDASNTPGTRKETAAEYRTVATLLPNDPVAQYDLGCYLATKGNQKREAIVALQAAERLAPPYRDAIWMEAWSQQTLNQFTECEATARRLIALDPTDALAWDALGDSYAFQKQDDQAIPALKKALSYSPCFPDAYLHLVEIYQRKQDYPGVIATCRSFLDGSPDGPLSSNYRDNMADAYLHLKQWENSADVSREAIELNDNDAIAHVNLGEALGHMGKKDEARQELQRTLQIGTPPEAVSAANRLMAGNG